MCAVAVPSRRTRLLVYLGAFLPDLCFKGLMIGFQSSVWFGEPVHSLWGGLLVSYAAALLFARDLRRTAFAAILAGYLSHLLLDLGKDNLGMGAILLFFPSMELWEIGLYRPEQSVDWMPFAAAAVVGIEWLQCRRKISPAGTA